MGPSHSFLGFVKNTPRDSSEGWAYINKHMWSSSSLRKNKEVLARNGGGKFGKGICFIFVLIGSKCLSWTWHPLFIIWSRFGKSICLSFDWLQGHFMCRLWVNAAKSLVVSFICSRAVHLNPLLNLPSVVILSLRVGLPCVQSPIVTYSVSLSNSVTHFVSLMGDTSAHYPESRLRNYLVPWNLHASMAGFLAFDSGFTSLTPDRNIMSDVRHQLIYSQSMDCTMVPWESLTSMVISLALVNGFINDQ